VAGPSNKRVAILSRKWSVRGGNERQAVELARHLVRAGHQVRVLCQKSDGTADDVLRAEKLFGIGFAPTASMVTWVHAAKRKIVELRRKREIDVAVGFNQTVLQDVFRLGGGTHAAFLEATKRHPEARGGRLLDRIALTYERQRLENTPILIAPCKRIQQELIDHYAIDPARIRVIVNGTDLSRFSPDVNDREETRKRWGVDPTTKVALFVGHNPYLKGLDLAQRACERTNLTLVYAGRAPKPPHSPPWLIWDGERRDMEKLYRAADLLLAPARFDTFGGVVLEAYASGLPAVASDLIGATDLARGTDLERLLVRDPEEIDRLVEAVRFALDHRDTLAIAARKAASGATLERWGNEMTACIDDVARGTKFPA
jgi:UDP-glucose:(heptosyl)LPS alpha-1,3-glucosyltransferase